MYQSSLKKSRYTADKIPNYLVQYEEFSNRIDVDSIDDYRNIPEVSRNIYFKSEIRRKWPQHEIMFTDGSKINNMVGSAVYYPKKNICIKRQISNYSSNFSAELKAIIEAYKLCIENMGPNFIIFTDCLSAIQKLKSISPANEISHLIAEIQKLNNLILRQQKTIKLVWIKAHIGIKENEIVDNLAKKAASEGPADLHYKTPKTDFYRLIKDKMTQDWQNYYNSANKATYFRNIKTKISTTPWFKNVHNKKFIQVISRLRTNHIISPSYKFKIGLVDNANCTVCKEIADPQHILFQCSLNTNNVNEFFTKLNNSNITSPFNLATLLTDENTYNLIYNHYNKSQFLFTNP